MINDEISGLLDKEYKSTMSDVQAFVTGTDESMEAIRKLAELHKQRMAESETNLAWEKCSIDDDHKDRELDLRERELDIRETSMTDDRELRTQELELKRAELDLRTAELERKTATENREQDIRLEEIRMKILELEEAKKTRRSTTVLGWVENGVKLFGLGLTAYWMAKTLEFEERGTFTSSAKNIVSSVFRVFKV